MRLSPVIPWVMSIAALVVAIFDFSLTTGIIGLVALIVTAYVAFRNRRSGYTVEKDPSTLNVLNTLREGTTPTVRTLAGRAPTPEGRPSYGGPGGGDQPAVPARPLTLADALLRALLRGPAHRALLIERIVNDEPTTFTHDAVAAELPSTLDRFLEAGTVEVSRNGGIFNLAPWVTGGERVRSNVASTRVNTDSPVASPSYPNGPDVFLADDEED